MRVLQGVGFSSCLPVMGSITSHWSTTAQTGIFMAILSSFLQVILFFWAIETPFEDRAHFYNASLGWTLRVWFGLAGYILHPWNYIYHSLLNFHVLPPEQSDKTSFDEETRTHQGNLCLSIQNFFRSCLAKDRSIAVLTNGRYPRKCPTTLYLKVTPERLGDKSR